MDEPTRSYSAESSRKWREENPERKREYDNEYRKANRAAENERLRQWRAANPEANKAIERRRSRSGRPRRKQEGQRRVRTPEQNLREALLGHHGMTLEQYVELRESQDGCCYLCEQPLVRRLTRIEHDHRCCPPRKSCAFCRRGLACNACNSLIGHAQDDVELLRRVAANLEVALASVTARLAAKPQQMELGYELDPAATAESG